jgi:hypothetical protein
MQIVLFVERYPVNLDPRMGLYLFAFLARAEQDLRVNTLPLQKPIQDQGLLEAFGAIQAAFRRDAHYAGG